MPQGGPSWGEHGKERRPFLSVPFLLPLLLLLTIALAAFLTSGIGAYKIPYASILRLWASPLDPSAAQGVDETARYIVLHVRLARVCLALVVGGALALAGAVYQGVLLNPLADPFTLGVSTGAAFGASLAILLGAGGVHFLSVNALPPAAFAGAVLALYMVYLLGRVDGRIQTTTLVLAGIIVSTFLSAWISLLKSLNEDSISTIVFWIMGSFSGKSWVHVLLVLPYLLVGMGIILSYARELDILTLGDIQAQQLGVNVQRLRFRLLLAASLVTAAAVAVSGVIGFVGLVVPHLVRLGLGPQHRRLLPAVILAGALLVLISDTLARSILPGGEELPVGVVTAILGGPFFCFLLMHRKKYLQL
ncbi:iron ABC transporter permease [Desulforhabdus sp. TSK]|nr:iron ABC transporter permease [Desulforhabdus sp. TSK]